MNGQRVIVAEFAISIAILARGATRQGFFPWPATVARAAFAFAVLSLMGLVNEKLAALLGAGFLLAQVLKTPVDANGDFKFTGGIPESKDVTYALLSLPGAKLEKSAVGSPNREGQKWSPGASNKGAALPIRDQKPGNGGIRYA